MQTKDFFYELPERLIAQTPIEPRDHARMLVYHKSTGALEHRRFDDVLEYLKAGDVLVVNNTRVLPARLYGLKIGGTARVEILLLKRVNLTDWNVLLKPGKRFPNGTCIDFGKELKAEVIATDESGGKTLRFAFNGVFEDILSRIGSMPLPHYIHEKLNDPERYQTVYNKILGSSAAPTAGLHFTKELLARVKAMGVEVAEVTLNVGLGTFRPVQVDSIEHHVMHTETFQIDEATAAVINRAKAEHRRIIAVGTTSVRVLESVAAADGTVAATHGETAIFIYPPYKFRTVDGLITNFHLPESTLIMLVSAFIGRENALSMYRTAVEQEYRFFSFGDATLMI